MNNLVYLLLGPLGCVLAMAVCMAMMARGKRSNAHPEPGVTDEVAALRAEVARLSAELAAPAELGNE